MNSNNENNESCNMNSNGLISTYVQTKIDPLLQMSLTDILVEHPADPANFMIPRLGEETERNVNQMRASGNSRDDPENEEFKSEVNLLRQRLKILESKTGHNETGTREEKNRAKRVSLQRFERLEPKFADGHSSDSDHERDYVGLPDLLKGECPKNWNSSARQAISAEVVPEGFFNNSIIPIKKDTEEISKMRATLRGTLIFRHLCDDDLNRIIDGFGERKFSAGIQLLSVDGVLAHMLIVREGIVDAVQKPRETIYSNELVTNLYASETLQEMISPITSSAREFNESEEVHPEGLIFQLNISDCQSIGGLASSPSVSSPSKRTWRRKQLSIVSRSPPKSQNFYSDDLTLVHTFGQNDVIGELDLISEFKSTLIYQARTDVSAWILDRVTCRQILISVAKTRQKEALEFLISISLFNTLTLDEITRLADVTRELQFNDGEVIIEQWRLNEFFYILKCGIIAELKSYDSKQQQPVEVRRLLPGSCFGENCLMVPISSSNGYNDKSTAVMESTFVARCSEVTKVLVISGADVLRLVGSVPELLRERIQR